MTTRVTDVANWVWVGDQFGGSHTFWSKSSLGGAWQGQTLDRFLSGGQKFDTPPAFDPKPSPFDIPF